MTSLFAQGYDRGGEDPAPISFVSIILTIIVVIIYIIIRRNREIESKNTAFKNLGINEKSAITIICPFAVKDKTYIVDPMIIFRNNNLVILSHKEALEIGEFGKSIEIPTNEIQSIELSKNTDSFTKEMGFTGALTFLQTNKQITQFVFNDKYDSEVRRFTNFKNEIRNKVNIEISKKNL
jgi:hypothetical protein